MNIEIAFNSPYSSGFIEWEYDGISVKKFFSKPTIAVWSEKSNVVVIQNPDTHKICIYSPYGEIISEHEIPEIDGYRYYFFQKNNISPSGVTLIFSAIYSAIDEFKDDIQCEMDFNKTDLLGKKIGIWR